MKGSRKPRIKGLETEFSIKPKKGKTRPTKQLILDNPEKMVGGFLPNGARYYIDAGKAPEYATPECLTVRDVVLFDKAGEKILLNDFSQFCRSIQKANYGIGQEGFFNLRAGRRGCHENYLIDSRLMEPRHSPLVLMLTPFLVSRQILAGRGGLYINRMDNKLSPIISKRAFAVEKLVNDETTHDRAIICTSRRGESYSHTGHRLHLILGDTNISEYSTFLKLGTTDLILTLLENDSLPSLWVDEPVKILHEMSADIRFENVYQVLMPSGQRKKMNAIDFQFWYLNLAQKFFERIVEPTDEEKFILNLWQETLDALKRNPMSLSDRLDYLIVSRLLEETKNILGSSHDDEKAKTVDYLYSELLPEKSWYLKQIKTGNVKRLLTDEEVDRATDNPPDNTRAKLRGEFIKIILKEKIGEHFSINWDTICFYNAAEVWPLLSQIVLSPEYNNPQLFLKDPYQTESDYFNFFKKLVIAGAEKLRELLSKEPKNKRLQLIG